MSAVPSAIARGCFALGLAALALLSTFARPASAADSLVVRASAVPDSAAADSARGPAPDFMLPDLDGTPRRFLGFPGRVLVLVYWSPECPECVREMPLLARLQARERAHGLEVVSVTYPRLREEAAAFARAKSLGFPVLLDSGGQVARLYGIRTTPTVCVVRGGRVVFRHAGFDPALADPVEPAVEAQLR